MTDNAAILERFSIDHYGRQSGPSPGIFSNIAIETCNVCNRGCDFCPVGHERKPVKRMDKDLFWRIIDELKSFHYQGDICFNWYNEPLLDKRLPEWIAIARGACPRSHIYFSTNGDLLNHARLEWLVVAGVSLVRVNQYDGAIAPNIQAILNAGHHLDRLCVSVKGAEILTNTRGGLVALSVGAAAPHAGEVAMPGVRCIRPDEQLIVDASGNVPLCCNDYHVSHCMGNVAPPHNDPLLSIWQAIRWRQARRWLRAGDRSQIPVCRGCNEPDTPYAASLPKGHSVGHS